jgi:predicted O-methyltransferase YrrM
MTIQGPADIVAVVNGVYAADLLTVIVTEFDLFTWLAGRECATVTEISESLGLDERAVDVTVTYLVALGLLDRLPDGAVRPTAVASEYLVAGGDVDLRLYLGTTRERPGCRDLVQVLKTGRPAGWASVENGDDWLARMATTEFADQFSAGMDARGRYLGPALAAALTDLGYRRVLDVGGSSGIYACSLVDGQPGATATVLDMPSVVDHSRAAIKARGFADRVDVLAGDMFESLPSGYDTHLYSNVFHDWDAAQISRLAVASFAALPPGGWLVDHDMHIDDTKTGPLPVAEFSIKMMHSTEGKCWSTPELAEILGAAGFTDVRCRPTTADSSAVIARKPQNR